MCPGRARSSGRVVGSSSACTVAQRSAAEMPVLVPWRASTDTVKAVRWLSVLSATMSGRRNSSSRCPSTGMQITPLVWRIMNAIASGVMASAAMIRSPSFSRSASSTTITSSPRAMAAMAFSISVKGISVLLLLGQQAFDVLGEHVDFEVDGVARLLGAERGDGEGVRDDRDVEGGGALLRAVVEGGDGEADPVDGDRALLDDVPEHRGGGRDGPWGRCGGHGY